MIFLYSTPTALHMIFLKCMGVICTQLRNEFIHLMIFRGGYMNLFYAVIVGFVLLCFSEYIVPELSLQSQHYSLYKHLKWINDSRNKCRFHPLSYYVIKRSKDINSFYALQDNDCKEYVPEILNYFVEDINKLYFQNEISLNTKVLHLEDEDYFLYRLFIFLDCHFEEPSFNGCRLYYIAE